jgi:hypothetical protein
MFSGGNRFPTEQNYSLAAKQKVKNKAKNYGMSSAIFGEFRLSFGWVVIYFHLFVEKGHCRLIRRFLKELKQTWTLTP